MPTLLKLKEFPPDFYTRNQPMPCMDPVTHQYRQEYPCPAVPCTPCWQHRKAPVATPAPIPMPLPDVTPEQWARAHQGYRINPDLLAARLLDKKSCQWCGVVFTRNPRRGNASWASRRYCSGRCGAAYANSKRCLSPEEKAIRAQESKECTACGATFYRGVPSIPHWETARYCSDTCKRANKARQ